MSTCFQNCVGVVTFFSLHVYYFFDPEIVILQVQNSGITMDREKLLSKLGLLFLFCLTFIKVLLISPTSGSGE